MATWKTWSGRLALPLLALACWFVASTAAAQVDAALHKDEAAPDTTVAVSEGEGGLEERFTIEFGDEKDWVRLASGEWLRGNVERMRDGPLDFNSDEIKLITYDRKKVRELQSPRAKT
jgi:hypothetical protein